MKKAIIRFIIIFALAALLSACFFGCRINVDENDPDESGAVSEKEYESETEEETVSEGYSEDTAAIYEGRIKIIENGKSKYTIVIPRSVGAFINQGAMEIASAYNNFYSASVIEVISENMVMSKEDTFEIVLGETDRSEYASKNYTYESYVDYSIRVDGNKIFIGGGSEYAIREACKTFVRVSMETEIPSIYENYSVKSKAEKSDYLVALTDQKNGLVRVYDLGVGDLNSPEALVWSYKTPHKTIAGVKLRHSEKYGDIMLAVCGSNYVVAATYPAGENVFLARAAASNPHSVELIPGDIIVVASSDGGQLRFFNIESTANTQYEFPDAHGVLWDPEGECLWAVGGDQLKKLKITDLEGNGKFRIECIETYAVPGGGAHDLAPYYGRTDWLWITGSKIMVFDKTKGAFISNFPGNTSLSSVKNCKGVGNFPDGSVVYIVPDGEYRDWTTSSIKFGGKISSGTYKFTELDSDTGEFYKVRVWSDKYQ